MNPSSNRGKFDGGYSVNDSMNMVFGPGERHSNFAFPITTTNDGGIHFPTSNANSNTTKAQKKAPPLSNEDYEDGAEAFENGDNSFGKNVKRESAQSNQRRPDKLMMDSLDLVGGGPTGADELHPAQKGSLSALANDI